MVTLSFEETIQFGLTRIYHNSLIIVSDTLQVISLVHQVDLVCFFHDSEMTNYIFASITYMYDQLYLKHNLRIIFYLVPSN